MDGLLPTRAPPLAAAEAETEIELETEAEAEATTAPTATSSDGGFHPFIAGPPRALDLDTTHMQEHKIAGTQTPTTDKHEPTAFSLPERLKDPRDPDRRTRGTTVRQGDTTSGTRPQLTIDTGVKNDRAIRNAVAGGLMSSPSSMFPAAYIAQLYPSSPYSTRPSSSIGKAGQSNTSIKRQSSRRGSVSGLVGRTGLVPTKAPTAQKSETTASATTTRDTSKMISRPDLHPYNHALEHKGLVQPLRSISYSGSTITSRTDPLTPDSTVTLSEWRPDGPDNPQEPHLQHHHHFPGLQKSKSFGIHSKKVFASQLRRLRQRRGSHESTSGLSSAGESDAEPVYGK